MGQTPYGLGRPHHFDAGRLTIDDYLCLNVAKSALDESILPGASHFKANNRV